MKILHLVKTATGATWALRQMSELAKLGVEVHVALPTEGELAPRYRQAGVIVHVCPADIAARDLGSALSRARGLRELVRRVRPDLVHSHFVGTTLLARLALGRDHHIPRVFQVPGPLHMEHAAFRSLEIGSAGKRDYWVASCKWTRQKYMACGIQSSRVGLSYYGIDCRTFRPQQQSVDLRKLLGIRSDCLIVGMVAFMYAPRWYLTQQRGLKGHEDLIDAIAELRRGDPRIVCVMIGGAWEGSEWYERRVKHYAARRCAGGVFFLGSRQDVADLYPQLTIVAHPSHSENLGGAVESLWLQRPTVATRVGGFPDVVRDGETGWLVPPADPPSLAAGIRQALEQPEEARRRALLGHKLVGEMLDVRRTAATMRSIYEQVLTGAALSDHVRSAGTGYSVPQTPVSCL